jgi:hypothetical protein
MGKFPSGKITLSPQFPTIDADRPWHIRCVLRILLPAIKGNLRDLIASTNLLRRQVECVHLWIPVSICDDPVVP